MTLRDGASAWLRSARADDVGRLAALFKRASAHALWLRFFTSSNVVDRRLLEQMAGADGVERVTLLVTRGEGEAESVLGVGGYVRLPAGAAADIAFFVDQQSQGQGIGTQLLERLAAYARRQGITRLTADVIASNRRMLDVFIQSGFEPRFSQDHEVLHVELRSEATDAAREQTEARERGATVASLTPLFRPRSVAVIGASRHGGIGRGVFDRLLQGGFAGPVYPVNTGAYAVGSVRAYASLMDVPDEVDLAVIAVPAESVPAVVDECVRKHVRAIVVLSAGFAETGESGAARQRELVRTVRANGMRMVGPNCIGILNTAADVCLNATFGPSAPAAGRIGMSSQSGALALAILDCAAEYQLGVSTFVAVGNRADVSTNDLLQYWEKDTATDVIALYVESFGNPRKFARIARRVARRKPVLALKSGRSAAGARAARSHTAALAGSDIAADALFRQAGIIRADTLDELFFTASLLAHQPLPRGNRVAVVTNGGGLGILAADACDAHGLTLPELTTETVESLRRCLPATASLHNPVDMIAAAGPEQYAAAVAAVLQDPQIDALIAIYIPAGLADTEAVAAAVRNGVVAAGEAAAAKPVLACFMTTGVAPLAFAAQGADPTTPATRAIPTLRYPEPAAVALSHAVAYASWRGQPPGSIVTPAGTDAAGARAVVAAALAARGEGWLRPDEAARLLASAGISLPAWQLAASADDAAGAAMRIGFPVAVKAVGATLLHKTDVGGVTLNLPSASAVRDVCTVMHDRLGDAVEAFLVQRMAEPGIELMAGVVDDSNFGPLVGFGLGGAAVEVLKDVVFRITPLTDEDARVMVRSIKALPLLQGYRGRPAADLGALEDLLLRLSWLVEEAPGIAELDLNPVIVYAAGRAPLPLDVRVRIRQPG